MAPSETRNSEAMKTGIASVTIFETGVADPNRIIPPARSM